MSKKITIIHHSADFDGLFSGEIAKKFLPDAQVIGWDFKDKPLAIDILQSNDYIYILDLPVDQTFGFRFDKEIPFELAATLKPLLSKIVWIDHHKSSIASHPKDLKGYRIDGVAACRLAWQWFASQTNEELADGHDLKTLPPFQDYGVVINKVRTEYKVNEPLSVKLAGQYDVWDKETPWVDQFQFGLKGQVLTDQEWNILLNPDAGTATVSELIHNGENIMQYQSIVDAEVVNARSFIVEWEGLKFLAMTTAKCTSLTFASRDVPETGHDALMGFFYDGKVWRFSLYHSKHRKDIDLSKIAVKHNGGGHAGACGFSLNKLLFIKDEYKIALEKIATYDKDSKDGEGICPYGCDCPYIAKEALGLLVELE